MRPQRRFWAGAILVAGLAGCARSEVGSDDASAIKNIPTIMLDEAHNHAANEQAADYSMPPGDRLIVDVGKYVFHAAGKFKERRPNSVHLVHTENEYCRAPWDGEGQVLIDANSAEPLRGKPRFAGFKSGETYLVGVGFDATEQDDDAVNFSVMWLGKVKVEKLNDNG